jgi:hypothetical protein
MSISSAQDLIGFGIASGLFADTLLSIGSNGCRGRHPISPFPLGDRRQSSCFRTLENRGADLPHRACRKCITVWRLGAGGEGRRRKATVMAVRRDRFGTSSAPCPHPHRSS